MALSKAMLDELVGDCKTPQDIEKLYSQMLQHMINRSLEAEMQAHLGHERHGKASGNPRNGKSRKTVQSAVGTNTTAPVCDACSPGEYCAGDTTPAAAWWACWR